MFLNFLNVTLFFRDAPGKYFYTRWVLAECLKVETFDSSDEVIVRRVCEVVATRGAFLAGAGKFIILLLPLTVSMSILMNK